MTAPITPSLQSGSILIVDDEAFNIRLMREYLAEAGYVSTIGLTNPAELLPLLASLTPDVILMDVNMESASGLELLAQLKGHTDFCRIPVLMLTASTDREVRKEALTLGAVDFINKPIDPDELLPRLRNTLNTRRYENALKLHAENLEREVQQRTAELLKTREEVIHCLARAAEFRDTDTGHHIMRVARYSALIARQIGCDPHFVHSLELASTLHDVGKIGIPDAILLKQGKLTNEEFGVMQSHAILGAAVFGELVLEENPELRPHTQLGAQLFSNANVELLQLAKTIAITHHEKFDGSGYPNGLKGDEIPLAGRIVAIADVYDALSSKRPYKPAYPRETSFALLRNERGKHFDPALLDAFLARNDDILAIQAEFADS